MNTMRTSQVLAAVMLLFHRRRRRRRRLAAGPTPPKFWVRQIFAKREQLGEFHTLVQEMRTSDRESFFMMSTTTNGVTDSNLVSRQLLRFFTNYISFSFHVKTRGTVDYAHACILPHSEYKGKKN